MRQRGRRFRQSAAPPPPLPPPPRRHRCRPIDFSPSVGKRSSAFPAAADSPLLPPTHVSASTLTRSLSLTICHTHSLTLYRIFNSTHVLGGGCRGWCAELSKDFQENKFCGFSLRSGWEREKSWDEKGRTRGKLGTWHFVTQNGNWTSGKMATRQMTKWQLDKC